MTRILNGLVIACAVFGASAASAQQTLASASSRDVRTRTIVAAFTKNKHTVKEKYGVRREKYKVVRSEAVPRSNPASYAGTYEVSDFGFTLRLRVDRNGTVEGSGEDRIGENANIARRFTLTNARIYGALLTATKVYANGGSERFEGAFMNRTSFDSPTDKGHTVFGLGVLSRPIHVFGVTVDKLFYALKEQVVSAP